MTFASVSLRGLPLSTSAATGGVVQKSENFVDVLNGSPLTLLCSYGIITPSRLFETPLSSPLLANLPARRHRGCHSSSWERTFTSLNLRSVGVGHFDPNQISLCVVHTSAKATCKIVELRLKGFALALLRDGNRPVYTGCFAYHSYSVNASRFDIDTLFLYQPHIVL